MSARARSGGSPAHPRRLTALRLWLALLGGITLGAGLVLHGQIAFAYYLRDEVERTFFLWRAIAEVTFAFQGEEIRVALGAGALPGSVLRECDRAAWALLIVGALLAGSAPLIGLPWHRSRRKGAAGV